MAASPVRPGLTARLLEEAYALDAARDAYVAWHWRRFQEPPPAPVLPLPPLLPGGRRTPKPAIICPRCGASRTTGNGTAHNPLALCRACQAALLPLVPREHRRRGFATAEGYRLARRRELDNARAAHRRTRKRQQRDSGPSSSP